LEKHLQNWAGGHPWMQVVGISFDPASSVIVITVTHVSIVVHGVVFADAYDVLSSSEVSL
jgi:hypothetical protein